MRTEIIKLLNMKQYFTVLQLKDNKNSVKLNLKKPSQLLMTNIHANWLRYNHVKSDKHNMPVFLNDSIPKLKQVPTVFGIVKQELQKYDNNTVLQLQLSNLSPLKKSLLQFSLMVPKQDAMQYLIQWQRYRKYWWSSISTTPSLFSVNEFKYENESSSVDIVAQLPSGQQPVENFSFIADENVGTSQLTCSICLEDALFILLLDGLNSTAEDNYLRLHRKMAPFKISFAVDAQNHPSNEVLLCKLANLLHHKLKSYKISAWLPDFSLPVDLQIKENLKLGVTYTGILEEVTLKYGIFKLMNSSTKLTELVHVADFCKYAAVIFESRT